MRQNAEAIGSGKTEEAARNAPRLGRGAASKHSPMTSSPPGGPQPAPELELAARRRAAAGRPALQERLRTVRPAVATGGSRTRAALEDLAGHIDPARAQAEGALRTGRRKTDRRCRRGPFRLGTRRFGRRRRGELSRAANRLHPIARRGRLCPSERRSRTLVLENALVERTGPVPPQYKDLVENYYRGPHHRT